MALLTVFGTETLVANSPNDNPPQPRHDILEVNNYLTSGLLESPIDKWFTGPIPCFSLHDLGIPDRDDSLFSVLDRVRHIFDDKRETGWTEVGMTSWCISPLIGMSLECEGAKTGAY